MTPEKLINLSKQLDGDLFFDETSLLLYATDASAYRQIPLAVALPKNANDIIILVQFARNEKTSLIPRAAGTSLAGQVVGGGIVVDISKYFTQILEINVEEHWARIQPGVVLDELNKHLEISNLFFGPETSTANRCTLGGMLGNNACGSHSIIYGSTRDHILEVKAILSDGSEVMFKSLTNSEFAEKCKGNSLESKVYQSINSILSSPENAKEITKEFPDSRLKRRNTGYALDILLHTAAFSDSEFPFNFSKLIAGSEGTLCIATELKINLVPLPPKVKAVVCAHFETLEDALKANLIALKFKPTAVELMDSTILNLTKENIEQQKNRFFVKGEPAAILIVEFARETKNEIEKLAMNMESAMLSAGLGYHFELVFGSEIKKVWDLRKAGLGVLSNVPGDAKPVSVIEDTAVHVELLPEYIAEFKQLIAKHKLDCVYHAHIGSGELHLRPLLNLKDPNDVALFRTIALETAKLVKKYRGSLSGEHGDGRLRGEFIPLMLGEHNYQIFKQIKACWDPENIFNPGKIVDTPQMNTSLRYEIGKQAPDIETVFDFSHEQGILRAAEKCNGSADCRKSELIGGTMCPSFMATRNESATTRARANLLREFLTNSKNHNPFNHSELYDIMDLCLSCKACKSECPSSVDMSKLKAEFLQHYYDANGIPFRTRIIANINKINALGIIFPSITNYFLQKKWLKSLLGFSPNRTLPKLYQYSFKKWLQNHAQNLKPDENRRIFNGKVYLFVDEFTNFNDVEVGIKTVKLLTSLGYMVEIPEHSESARTYLSKGLVRKAQEIAIKNVNLLKNKISDETPLVGIEPSAILSFRDDYIDLIKNLTLKQDAKELARNTFLIDEFIANEIDKGNIHKSQFTENHLKIKLHGHCQQKAISSTQATKKILSFPVNYKVEEIPSGCCGMAGSFGYEKEHYALSMQIGELVLFKHIRKTDAETEIAAVGTSCRHQIKDGTNRIAKHPIEILYEALLKS